MGKRERKRGARRGRGRSAEAADALAGALGLGAGELPAGELSAPASQYADAEANVLELRGSLTLKARREYTDTLHGGLHQDDASQRATELLFERLAVSWTINGVRTERQRELLARYRAASASERQFVRESLRAHAAEWFPDIEVP